MCAGMLLAGHDAAGAAEVRHTIADDLRTQSVTRDSINNVVLVASELVGNAVRHAGDSGRLDVAWDLTESCVIVRVNDASEALPAERVADAAAVSGRGLAIVAALSTEWGVRPFDRGKQVWARVPVLRAV